MIELGTPEKGVDLAHERGPWVTTASGKRFYPLAPEPEDLNIHDIAHSLSKLCRFNGHTLRFYSVAEHSVLCSEVPGLTLSERRWALMHDVPEYVIGDMVRPLKVTLDRLSDGAVSKIEGRIERCIVERYNLALLRPPIIKEVDLRMCATEKRDLMVDSEEWPDMPEPYHFRIQMERHVLPAEAEDMFIERFGELFLFASED